jgi:hypothetical protein
MAKFLTQQEADALRALKKHCREKAAFVIPSFGGDLRIPLYSSDNREEFILDISRGSISLGKEKLQTRARTTVILVRVEISGAPHRNPDGEEVKCPHIHLYREGFDDKWAEPLEKHFKNIADPVNVLQEFMDYCNIITKPVIEGALFS